MPAPAARPAEPRPLADAGPAGFAELFLGLWLRSGTGEQSPAARAFKTMAPSVRPPVWGKRPPAVEEIAAVRTVRVADGGWSVTVAVAMPDNAAGEENAEDAGVRYFAVPVTLTDQPKGGDAWAFTAGAPSEVSGPAQGQTTDSLYGTPVKAGPLADSVSGFLAAYLGTTGGADRYLAPKAVLPPLSTATYLTVEPQQILADRTEREQEPSRDGVRIRVRADVTATDAAGRQWPLSYALALATRAGRWEITALDSGLTTPTS
ncbi:conjugal transfer protein [Streptomyces sp. NPDC050600]|uniref:conjugal transfer protein n=1 Tax=Streptomyces sp. NPDC050600 TaxID=3157213 RepID=UPI003434C610